MYLRILIHTNISSMGLKGKLVAEVKVCSAQQFLNQFRQSPQQFSGISDSIQGFQVLGGNLGQQGSVIHWNYTQLDGKACTAKETIEFDQKDKSMKITVTGGDPLEGYKSMVITLNIIPGIGISDNLRWTIDYETLCDNGPPPLQLRDVIVKVSRDFKAENLQTI